MITKVSTWGEKQGDKIVHIFEFPELDVVSTSDPEIQKILIRYGVAVGLLAHSRGPRHRALRPVELRAGGANVNSN